MIREPLLEIVKNYAEDLVAQGAMDSFQSAFDSEDPNFDVSSLTDAELFDVYKEFVADSDNFLNCRDCGCFVNPTLGSFLPVGESGDCEGTKDDPRPPGCTDDICANCNYS